MSLDKVLLEVVAAIIGTPLLSTEVCNILEKLSKESNNWFIKFSN